jgi:wobble nucleotide-excising tRNase
LRILRQAAITILDQKAGAPLEALAPDSGFSAAHKAYLGQQNEVAVYNGAVRVANDLITAKRAATAASDVKTVESTLLGLHAIRRRNDPDGTMACQEYQAALDTKARLEAEKAASKEKLDDHTKAVINQYEKSINVLLDEFQAGFRITETQHGYPGGVASCGYQILINETPVELGDSTTALDRPSFKNTLSSGDKSTLALAFFLAQLEHDSERATKIIVFDDPFNSQDSFRKDCTVQNIKKCGGTSAQVIVLSHDQGFLKRIWDRLAPQATERKCLQLARIGVRNTTISEWDIEQATQARFIADRNALADYYNTGAGNPRDIVNKIRPVLEAYSKNLYPSEFAADMLGTMIGKIRTTGASHAMFPVMDDLDALNEYTRRYHHGENPNAATEPINDTELQGFVKKTLAIIGCC